MSGEECKCCKGSRHVLRGCKERLAPNSLARTKQATRRPHLRQPARRVELPRRGPQSQHRLPPASHGPAPPRGCIAMIAPAPEPLSWAKVPRRARGDRRSQLWPRLRLGHAPVPPLARVAPSASAATALAVAPWAAAVCAAPPCAAAAAGWSASPPRAAAAVAAAAITTTTSSSSSSCSSSSSSLAEARASCADIAKYHRCCWKRALSNRRCSGNLRPFSGSYFWTRGCSHGCDHDTYESRAQQCTQTKLTAGHGHSLRAPEFRFGTPASALMSLDVSRCRAPGTTSRDIPRHDGPAADQPIVIRPLIPARI